MLVQSNTLILIVHKLRNRKVIAKEFLTNLLNCVPCVLTCQRALRAFVLTCQRVLRTYVLTCQRALSTYVLTCRHLLRAYVLTWQRALRAYMLMFQRALRAYVLTFQRALGALCFTKSISDVVLKLVKMKKQDKKVWVQLRYQYTLYISPGLFSPNIFNPPKHK